MRIETDDKYLYKLVTEFRDAMDIVSDTELFKKDIVFRSFPRGCCGDTCYLLAEYLRGKHINTIYVCGDYKLQSHAWLVVNDYRVNEPKKYTISLPDRIKQVYKQYSSEYNYESIEIKNYEESDLYNGLIIDITGDQFGEVPVYVNYMDDFHGKFEFESAHDFERLNDSRLYILYRKIIEQIN